MTKIKFSVLPWKSHTKEIPENEAFELSLRDLVKEFDALDETTVKWMDANLTGNWRLRYKISEESKHLIGKTRALTPVTIQSEILFDLESDRTMFEGYLNYEVAI